MADSSIEVDRRNVEPGSGMHSHFTGMHELLRDENGSSASGYAPGKV